MGIMHWIGIDDHADKWTIAVFEGNADEPKKVFELTPDDAGYRRLVKFAKELGGEVRIVYEAGPCGFNLYRKLRKSGLSCQVAAPTLTPRKPGEKVKTNRKDAIKLAKYLRGGDLTFIMVPDESQESLRDLVRARQAVQEDVGRIRRKIIHLLLRYGYRYRNGSPWTSKFFTWLKAIRLPEAHSQFVLDELIGELAHRVAQLSRFDTEIELASRQPEYATYVAALRTLRGIETLSAMTLLSELGDLRRFPTPRQLMAAIGLVPSEYSTGDHTQRFSITKMGNAHVRHIAVEAAWQYERRPVAGRTIARRRKDQPKEIIEIAEKCEKRLNRRFHRLAHRGKRRTVVAVAVARELVGFIWAIGQIAHP